MRKGTVLLLLFLTSTAGFAQRTDLSGLKFCIDPGHGGHNPANDRLVHPDPGVDFWESEGNFQKALFLRTLLQAQGASVILTRETNDYPLDNEPSLTARWTLANTNAVDWFHSIHSNATGGNNTGTNYTLMLVKEVIATRTAAFPEAVVMSNLMGPAIRGKLRTTASSTALDYTFYGGPAGGFNLGVLSGLLMPGELSEGSFHDFYPETRRLMNNDYRKMEAYALRNAIMAYYGAPADTRGIIAGIQTDIAGGSPINQTRVRVLPGGGVYNGDQDNNGFYMFDSLAPGTYTIFFETSGYQPDSAVVTISPGAMVFVDRTMETFAAPHVYSSIPAANDTSFAPNQAIVLNFSKIMDTASVKSAFSIIPPAPGVILWANNNTSLRFTPTTPLAMPVSYTVRVDTGARSAGGQGIDGNSDGVPGDAYVLQFTTKVLDVVPPAIAARFPDSAMTVATPFHNINMTFDEPLNPATVSTTNFSIIKIGGAVLSRTLQYSESAGKGSVAMYVTAGLQPGASYMIRVSGVKDQTGNIIPPADPLLWSFSVATGSWTRTTIDSLNTGPISWVQPGNAAETTGVDSSRISLTSVPAYPAIAPNSGAASLSYRWNTGASSWLLWTLPVSGAPSRDVQWTKFRAVLTAFVNGDGGKSQFRFVVRDSVDAFPAGTSTSREVSRWYTIDWVGWRLVEWDMEKDSVGEWVGNGSLEGMMQFDGIQMRYLPGVSALSGEILID